tara:strand:+ start:34 stop:687 length:654 start_codon:yes stop_codon:yes gene_type:complete
MNNEAIKRIISSIIIIPIFIFLISKGSIYFTLFLITFFLIATYEWINMCKNKIHSFLGIIFLLLSTYFAFLLRGNDSNGLFIFLFVIIICVATDIGGYIFGKIFKGPKLTRISPNKTYSGMIGSYFLSITFAYLFINEYNIFLLNSISFTQDNIKFFILIFLISTVSQLGDLFISYFKRLSKIKNTGKIIPGHGGLLDRVDGIIFAIPFCYLLFRFI